MIAAVIGSMTSSLIENDFVCPRWGRPLFFVDSHMILVVNTRSCNWRAGKSVRCNTIRWTTGTSSVQGMARVSSARVVSASLTAPSAFRETADFSKTYNRRLHPSYISQEATPSAPHNLYRTRTSDMAAIQVTEAQFDPAALRRALEIVPDRRDRRDHARRGRTAARHGG